MLLFIFTSLVFSISQSDVYTDATTDLVKKLEILSESTPSNITIPASLTISEDISGKNSLIEGVDQDLNVNLVSSNLSLITIVMNSGAVNLQGPIVAGVIISGDTIITIQLDGERKTSPFVVVLGNGKPHLKLVTSTKPSTSYQFCIGTIKTLNYSYDFMYNFHTAKPSDIGFMVGYDNINFTLMEQLVHLENTSSYDDRILTDKLIVIEAQKDQTSIIIGVAVAVVVGIIIIIVVVVVMVMKKKKTSVFNSINI
ncbi:hypothetical protein TRFO_05639 [Tritrichomonas foetus]|uniref:Uncharacterized protein n=1 Tax=Tritrichomonas foetus TaxID=1144522 RepID=A0A1J4K566_9EUKA|nr:hypothetical protein TRFO_05639 [Tritrichomonas foetus]|eukprot:OHT06008.1 hypothetical protein TRFO_05639 [Tritrichomonas foetus]